MRMCRRQDLLGASPWRPFLLSPLWPRYLPLVHVRPQALYRWLLGLAGRGLCA